MHFSWRSPAIRGLQSDCRYVNNNEQITCRSHARALGANDGDGAGPEPLDLEWSGCFHRDVMRGQHNL